MFLLNYLSRLKYFNFYAIILYQYPTGFYPNEIRVKG